MERLIKILTVSDKRARLLISGDLGMAWSVTAKLYILQVTYNKCS